MSSKKPLKFIHITKCAGTSIEQTAITKNIQWGKYHTEYGWWHGIFRDKPKELKEAYDWFTVVRNPYDRIMSEYYCNFNGIDANAYPSRDESNKILIEHITNRSKKGNHYTEQYKYIDDSVKIHILKFENLEEEFKKLMEEYNIHIGPLQILNTNNKYRFFKMRYISPEVIQLINEVYKKDFEMFGYEMKTKL